MHPILTMREWAHIHPIREHRGLSERLSHLAHSERMWITVGIVVYLLAILGVILLSGRIQQPPIAPFSVYPFNQY
jgi:hypothetical protein